jgi:hypothetical protein
VTVSKEEELEQVLEATQEGKEKEHSEEWLNDFGQGAEKKEVAALNLTTEDKVITPWEMELEMLEDWLNNREPARELTEVELSEKVTEQKFSQRETAELNSTVEWQLEAIDEYEEDGVRYHSDLPMCQKNLQLGRLQKQDQPLEQLDVVIEEIRRLMLRSEETSSEERLGKKEAAATAEQKQQ